MTVNISLMLVVGVLFGAGAYLLLARSVVRALIGFTLMSNGVNVMFLMAAGDPGDAPIIKEGNRFEDMTDPLPQAMVLTAIVIGLCIIGFLLALAHRGFQLSRTDVLTDDPEDARIRERAVENDMSASEYNQQAEDDLGESERPRTGSAADGDAAEGREPAAENTTETEAGR